MSECVCLCLSFLFADLVPLFAGRSTCQNHWHASVDVLRPVDWHVFSTYGSVIMVSDSKETY
jgi:hypothetical protein